MTGKYFFCCTGKNKGFTLIEILVAVTLSVVLIGALYATFFTVVRAGEGAAGEVEELIRVGRFFDGFTGEVHSAFFRPGSPETVFTGTINGTTSSITFTTLTHPFIKEGVPTSDLAGVSYFAEDDGEGVTLFRESFNPYTKERFRVEVMEDIEGFEVSFFNGRDWSMAWDAALEGRLPVAVRVLVRLDKGREFSALSRVMIR